MRRTLMSLTVGALMVVGCSSGPSTPAEPVDTSPAEAPSNAGTPTPSIPPGTQVINGCPIMADTSCHGANLTTAPLSGADLRGADLREANLYGADLRETDLRDADLTGADMRNADLSGADLVGATVKDASFKDANLFQTDFENSDVTNGLIKKALRCETILANGHQDDSGCNDEISPTPEPQGDVKITKFDLPETVSCSGTQTQVTVNARFAVENAKTVEFDIDDSPMAGDQTFNGSDTRAKLPFECSSRKHTYTLIASDNKGSTSKEKLTVTRAA